MRAQGCKEEGSSLVVFVETALPGAYILEPERLEDERGFFARTYCDREFAAHGIGRRWVQSNISYNRVRGTLRGMHYQVVPYAEDKLVRCTRGAIHDVIVDIRPESPAYKQHIAVELSGANRRALFVPKGFAHGFLTMEDDSEVSYQMSEFYVPGAGAGFRYNDPVLAISWPGDVKVISERDRTYADFEG